MMTSDTEDDFLSEIDEMILGIEGVTGHNKIEKVARMIPLDDDFYDLEQDDSLKDHKNHGPPVPSQRLYPSGSIAGRQNEPSHDQG
jgi:hypothetical protein